MSEIKPEDLPPWVKGMMDLRTNKAVWPVSEFVVGKFGAFGAQRTKPSEGLCGPRAGEKTPMSQDEERKIVAARYPCKHYGADLRATEGTPVVVPHDGYLLYLGPADKPPFVGYGPDVALIANADVASNMWRRVWKWATGPLVDIFDMPEETRAASYTLIGHFDRKPGPIVPLPGDIWNTVAAKPNPDHWRRLGKDRDHIVMMSDADAVNDEARRVFMGQELGWVNGRMGHVHWEMRKAPIADKTQRFDPVETWRQVYQLALPGASRVAMPASGGGGGALLLLAALLMGKRKRRR